MRRLFALLPVLCALAGAAPQPRLLVISVDGLDQRYLRDADRLGLRIPNLRRLIAGGEWAQGVIGVVPTVTWASHTSLITGAIPGEHGILGNRRPREDGGDYYWSVSLLKRRTLWHAAHDAGLRTAAVTWPVTVDAPIDFNLPEYFQRRNGGGMDLASIESKATPGLAGRIAAAEPSFRREWMDDRARALAVVWLLKHEHPDLILLHLVDHDAAAHDHGPFSAEANAEVERTDGFIGQLVAAAPGYTVAVVSDHGFERVDRAVPAPAVPNLRAMPTLAVALDEAAATAMRNARLGAEIPMAEFRRRAPQFPNAVAAFDPPEHAVYGPRIVEKGEHGYWPLRPDFRSVFVLRGEGIPARRMPEMEMTAIAARLARVLGLAFPF